MKTITITVTEITADPTGTPISTAEVFKQSVDALDLTKLFTAVNAKPRKPRAPKPAKA